MFPWSCLGLRTWSFIQFYLVITKLLRQHVFTLENNPEDIR